MAAMLKPSFRSRPNAALIASIEASVSSNTSPVISLMRPTSCARSRKLPGVDQSRPRRASASGLQANRLRRRGNRAWAGTRSRCAGRATPPQRVFRARPRPLARSDVGLESARRCPPRAAPRAPPPWPCAAAPRRRRRRAASSRGRRWPRRRSRRRRSDRVRRPRDQPPACRKRVGGAPGSAMTRQNSSRPDAREQILGAASRASRSPILASQRLARRCAVKGDDLGELVDLDDRRRRTPRRRCARRSNRPARGRTRRGWAGRSRCRNRRARTDRPACAAARRNRRRRRRDSCGPRSESAPIDQHRPAVDKTLARGSGASAATAPTARVGGVGENRRAVASRTSRARARGVEGGAPSTPALASDHDQPGSALENLRAQLLETRRRRRSASGAVAGLQRRRRVTGAAGARRARRSSSGRAPPRRAAPAVDHLARRIRARAVAARRILDAGTFRCAARDRRGSSVKRRRAGSGKPSPNATTSRVPSEGTKASRLATASVTAERSSAWSRSLAMRIANRVLHCEMIVGSSSPGRWVTRPR